MTAPLLQLDGLRAGYGHVEVLHEVSLSVAEGQMVAIVGPNGAGKTTLMGAVMGLLPRRGGVVRYLGAPAGHTEAMVASGVTLVTALGSGLIALRSLRLAEPAALLR